MLKVKVLSGGRNVPSARFRYGQICIPIKEYGIDMQWNPTLISKYPPKNKTIRPVWGALAVLSHVPGVIKSWGSDVTIFPRELVSTLVTLEPFTKEPRVFDVDDAIWLKRDGKFAEYLAKHVDLVIAGNDFLADWFSKWNSDVVVIPTSVDTQKYIPSPNSDHGNIIGWSGTSSNFQYLYTIEPALKTVLAARPNALLRIIADERPHFKEIPSERVQYIKWTPQNEVSSIQEINIGIMPLVDSVWSRGKCSFKMLLYMSCGKPVVVSPIGMNKDVLSFKNIGYAANSMTEWSENIISLLDQKNLACEYGKNGREVVECHYSVKVIAPKLANYLKGMVS